MKEFAHDYFESIEKRNLPINDHFHLCMTSFDMSNLECKKKIVDDFANADDFAEAIVASSTIPFFT